MEIGGRIRDARKARGFSQEELARRAGMSLKGMAYIERGRVKNPHYETLTAIADALGVPVGALLGEESQVPLAQAPPETPEEDEERRAKAFRERFDSEEECLEYVMTWPKALEHYNTLLREIKGQVEAETIKTLGAHVIMDAFVSDRVYAVQSRSGAIAYLNAVLQGDIEASDETKDALREIAKRMDAEGREAQRIVENTRDIENLKRAAEDMDLSAVFATAGA